ncbi:MAG: hypothetical protein LBM98_09575 [Oscillospiraceae bacterium]|nr:hypothetical protein [Oscillospiraceae bacterium]
MDVGCAAHGAGFCRRVKLKRTNLCRGEARLARNGGFKTAYSSGFKTAYSKGGEPRVRHCEPRKARDT